MDTPLTLHLEGDLASSSRARRFVREALADAVGDDLLQDALLLTSELVTNATVHAGGQSHVEIDLDEERLVLRVSDDDRRAPVRRLSFGGPTSTGRGLQLLEALSERWGVEVRDDGKTVWVVLRR